MLALRHGRVRGVPNVTPDKAVMIVDYDIEDQGGRAIKPSPLDGKPCRLRKCWSPSKADKQCCLRGVLSQPGNGLLRANYSIELFPQSHASFSVDRRCR